MRAILLISTLFKTTEFKINSSRNLEVTELSLSGVNSKSLLLNSLNVRQDHSTPSYLPWLILLGAISTLAVLFFNKEYPLIQSNLLNIVFFLSCIFGTLWIVSRPEKCHTYTDSFTGKVLFKINNPLATNDASASFINKLDSAIEISKKDEENLINLRTNAKSQYEMHNKNVDDLMNSGLIDEALYKRICNSMHESVFGKEKEYRVDNVVYLNK